LHIVSNIGYIETWQFWELSDHKTSLPRIHLISDNFGPTTSYSQIERFNT